MTIQDLQTAIQSDIVVVDFTATWCTVCHALFPIVEQITQQSNIRLLKLDADVDAEVFDHYEVYGVPHIKVFVNGKEKASSIGPKQKEDIESMIAQCTQDARQEQLAYMDYF